MEFKQWQEYRSQLYKNISQDFDLDKELKIQAGIEELSEYANFYEIQLACDILNCSDNELMEEPDAYVTKHLLSKRKDVNFEKRFRELKYKP